MLTHHSSSGFVVVRNFSDPGHEKVKFAFLPIHICIYIHKNMYKFTYMYVCIDIYIYISPYICMQLFIFTYMYMYENIIFDPSFRHSPAVAEDDEGKGTEGPAPFLLVIVGL
jgi:hypothetical protein